MSVKRNKTIASKFHAISRISEDVSHEYGQEQGILDAKSENVGTQKQLHTHVPDDKSLEYKLRKKTPQC